MGRGPEVTDIFRVWHLTSLARKGPVPIALKCDTAGILSVWRDCLKVLPWKDFGPENPAILRSDQYISSSSTCSFTELP